MQLTGPGSTLPDYSREHDKSIILLTRFHTTRIIALLPATYKQQALHHDVRQDLDLQIDSCAGQVRAGRRLHREGKIAVERNGERATGNGEVR